MDADVCGIRDVRSANTRQSKTTSFPEGRYYPKHDCGAKYQNDIHLLIKGNERRNNHSGKTFKQNMMFCYRGFDNSDKNTSRHNIGSCTDLVAKERKEYGPWQSLDFEGQRELVARLASQKALVPPDPRFASWVNHFQYFWNIGANVKQMPKSRQQISNMPETVNRNASPGRVSEHNGLYLTHYHKLLRKRLRSSSQIQRRVNENENSMEYERAVGSSEKVNDEGMTGKHTVPCRKSRIEGETIDINIHRGFSCFQRVNKKQITQIVNRLTRSTSAYNAKFAPNPHVWVDTSPGAHMVMKREKCA